MRFTTKITERLALVAELRQNATETEVERVRRGESEYRGAGDGLAEEHAECDNHHDGVDEPLS